MFVKPNYMHMSDVCLNKSVNAVGLSMITGTYLVARYMPKSSRKPIALLNLVLVFHN